MCTVQNTTTKMNEVCSWKDRLLASNKTPNTPSMNGSVSHVVRDSAQTNGKGRTRNRRLASKTSTRHAPQRAHQPAHQPAHQQASQEQKHAQAHRQASQATGTPNKPASTASIQQVQSTKGPRPATPAKPYVQLLHSKWTLYYHNPNSNDWSNASYRRILQFHSVEAFCAYYKEMEFEECAQGMFFLMRGDIMPTWEDAHNKNGGCWSFKVSLEHFFYVWKHLSALLVGETLSSKPLLLNGISVSPKRGFCIVKLWNHDSALNKTDVLKLEKVDYLEDNGPALYTPFHTKK